VIDHHLAVARDPVSMKSGLEDPAVPPMRLPLGTEKPLTRDALSRLERQPSEVTLMGNQHVLDVVGVGEQVELYSAESIVGDVAVAARRTQEQSERIASERKEGHPGEPVARAGWQGRIADGIHLLLSRAEVYPEARRSTTRDLLAVRRCALQASAHPIW